MERTRVQSSNISSIGYEENSRTLEIEFNTGKIYQYSQVSENVYKALMNAPSHGSYFNANVRSAYPTRQVR